VVFVAVLLAIAGTLNIIYGIATVGNAHFFANTQHALSSLHIWAWITLIVGIIQLTVRASLSEAGATAGSSASSRRASARSRRCFDRRDPPMVAARDFRPLHVRPAWPDRLRGRPDSHNLT
jgi:hypothetical protein